MQRVRREGLLEMKWHPTKLLHGKMLCAEDQDKLWGSVLT